MLSTTVRQTIDPTDLGGRDPERLRQILPTVELLYDRYFRCETHGIEHVPKEAAILFGNHCGSTYTMEAALLSVALLRRFGVEHPLYYLVHGAFFDPPYLREFMRDVGGVLASREVAERILDSGGQFIVFPGGDRDSHKPFYERHRVNFFGHTGFIRTAIERRVPLVPFVHVGTHEMFFVLSRGERLAKLLRLRSLLNINVCPITLSFPFGLSIGPYFLALPLPSKVVMKVMPPYRPWEEGCTDPNDPKQLQAALQRITLDMQRELDSLAGQRRLPVLG